MNRLNKILINQYADHYARVNITTDPLAVSKRNLATLQVMFGSLVEALPAKSRVLDLGCGTGVMLHWLSMHPGIVPLGVDSSPKQVEIAQQAKPDIDIICEDGLEYLSKYSNAFGGVLCTDVLEHLSTAELCLEWVEGAVSALIPGGFFCCRSPNAASMTATYSRYMDLTHQRLFTSTSLLQLLEAGGLQNCRIMPIREAYLRDRFRLAIERLLHRIIFRICGHKLEWSFSNNVCAIGFKGQD